ncbi:MAG: YkvI family membrane protein, partial [Caulobacteraceae bacterium]
MMAGPTLFQRYLLPGFAFKAVVIGGGYATGRELTEFFLPSGPRGGVLGMVLAMAIWSAVCALTFLFARAVGALDYRTFFKALLGRFWVAYEIVYGLFIVLILAVFAAAAGAIGQALFGWPTLAGTLCLVGAIAAIAVFGNNAVERLFKYATLFIYAVYALFVVLALSSFGGKIAASFALPTPIHGWALAGLSYSGYNVIAAVVVLPVLRHMTSGRDAFTAGLLAGPLAMLPAILFFVCMAAYYPEIGNATLPSDFLLRRMNAPFLHYLFQLMIFAGLLESAVASVNAINERAATAWRAGRG